MSHLMGVVLKAWHLCPLKKSMVIKEVSHCNYTKLIQPWTVISFFFLKGMHVCLYACTYACMYVCTYVLFWEGLCVLSHECDIRVQPILLDPLLPTRSGIPAQVIVVESTVLAESSYWPMNLVSSKFLLLRNPIHSLIKSTFISEQGIFFSESTGFQ